MWYGWGVLLANLNIKREDEAKRWRREAKIFYSFENIMWYGWGGTPSKAEPGSQGAKQDVLENIRKGWCRTTAERRKRKIFKIFQNTMWYGKGILYYGVAAN